MLRSRACTAWRTPFAVISTSSIRPLASPAVTPTLPARRTFSAAISSRRLPIFSSPSMLSEPPVSRISVSVVIVVGSLRVKVAVS